MVLSQQPTKNKFFLGYDLGEVKFLPRYYVDEAGEVVASDNYHSVSEPIYTKTSQFTGIGFNERPLGAPMVRMWGLHVYSGNNYLGFFKGLQLPPNLKEHISYVRIGAPNSNAIPTQGTYKVAEFYAVTPYYKRLTQKWAKEKDQQFFRKTLEGDIILRGNDYDLIKTNFRLGEEIRFMIFKDGDPHTDMPFYEGYFSKIDCEFDKAKKSVKLKVTPDDGYNKVLARMDEKFDLLKFAPATTPIGAYKRPVEQIYVAGADSVTNFQGGTYWEYPVKERIYDHDTLQNTYHFNNTEAFGEIEIKDNRLGGMKSTCLGEKSIYKVSDNVSIKIEREGNDARINYYIDERIHYESNKFTIGYETIMSYAGYLFLAPGHTIRLHSLLDFGNEIDTIDVKGIAVYNIYRRRLADVPVDTLNNKLYKLDSNDFAANTAIYSYGTGAGADGGVVMASTHAVDEPTRYGKNDYGKYFSNSVLPLSSGRNPFLPVCRNSWANVAIWFSYNYINMRTFDVQYRKEYAIKDTYNLADVIKALLKEIDPSLNHGFSTTFSKFLYGKGKPIGGFDDFHVFITQKTNVLKGEYDQAAQKAEITLGQVLDMLKKCFQCYWFIDGSLFRIEHISYFNWGGKYSTSDSSVRFDSRKLTDNFNRMPILYQQQTIEYNKALLNSGYEFDYMEDAGTFFSGMSLSLKDDYLKDSKVEKIKVDGFSADIDMMLLDPERFSNDGFALLCARNEPGKHSKADYYLPMVTRYAYDKRDGTERLIEVDIQNAFASWLYLMRMYMHNLSGRMVEADLREREMTGGVEKRFMTGSIHFKEVDVTDVLSTRELIQTEITDGAGQIEELTTDLDTKVTDMKLLFYAED